MKKLVLLFALSLALFSCKKCVECTQTATVTNYGTSYSSSSTSQFCGTKKEVNEYEEGLKNGNASVSVPGASSSTQVTCKDL